jgi:hypothetical protein
MFLVPKVAKFFSWIKKISPILCPVFLLISIMLLIVSDISLTVLPKEPTAKVSYGMVKLLGENNKSYSYNVLYDWHKWSHDRLTFSFDDCFESVTLNGKLLQPKIVDPCYINKKTELDISEFSKEGQNSLVFNILNREKDTNFAISVSNYSRNQLLIFVFLLLALLCLILAVSSYLKLPNFAIIAILLATVLRFDYLMKTGYDERGYDVMGHVDYVSYILTNYKLPTPDTCWQCYHPPIYYSFNAIIYKILEVSGLATAFSLTSFMQWFSLTCFTLFNITLIQITQLFWSFSKIKYPKWMMITGVFLISFWPSFALHSIRLGNDVMLYLWFAIGFYWVSRWWFDHRLWQLLLSLIFCGLAIYTKSNGLLLLIVIATLILARWVIEILPFLKQFKSKKINVSKLSINILKKSVSIIVSAILVGIIMIPFVINIVNSKAKDPLVANSGGLGGALTMESKMKHYLLFDADGFVKKLYAEPFNQDGFRDFYWNYSLKTALIGEFSYAKEVEGAVYLLSFIFVLLLGYFAVSVLTKNSYISIYLPLISLLFVSFVCHLYIRSRISFSPTQDFRYILFTIMPFSIFLLHYLAWEKYPVLKILVRVLVWTFILTGIAFTVLIP